MKRYTRFVILFVLVMALVVPTFAQAQDMPCYGLSASDCDLFYKAEATASEVTSAALSYDLTLSADPGMEITSSGSGSFTFDASAADPFKALSLSMDTNSSATVEGETAGGPLSFRLVDGVVYVTFDGTSWEFISVDDLLSSMGIPMDPSILFGDMSGAETDPMATEMMGEFNAMMERHISVSRIADENIDGNTVAVFVMDVDLAGMFSDPQLGTALTTAMMMSATMGGDTSVDMESLNQMMPMVTQLGSMLFGNSEMSFTTKVGVDNGYFYGFGFDFSMTLDPMMMAAAAGAPPDAEAEPTNILMSLSVDLTQHNSDFSYEAPAGATPMDTSTFGMPGF